MREIRLFFLAVSLIGIFCCQRAVAETKEHLKNWDTLIISGPLSSESKFKYYLQPQLNLIDDKYKFNTAFLYAGIGYQYASNMTFWLMDGYVDLKKINGQVEHINVIRQQLDWDIVNTASLIFSSTSRLEERKNFAETEWAYRVRERLTLRVPFPQWEDHSLVLFDEAFFNINHPAWITSNSFMQQNRAFIGIGTVLSKQVSFDIGYLNQYVMNNTDSLNNVLYLAFNVVTG